MVYYKIPLSGGLDYPAGCILSCAYTYGGYECCKFERVTEVGDDWEAITEAEFNVRCPEFPEPAAPPVQEVIATAAQIVDGAIVLDLPRKVDTGTLVKFDAPCDCTAVTKGIEIDGIWYSVVDSNDKVVTGIPGAWVSGAHIVVIIDMEDRLAYIQGTAPLPVLIETSPLILVEGRDYGIDFPTNPVKGQLFFKKV